MANVLYQQSQQTQSWLEPRCIDANWDLADCVKRKNGIAKVKRHNAMERLNRLHPKEGVTFTKGKGNQ